MIHYHGLPITPDTAAIEVAAAGHAFISFRHRQQLGLAIELCQSFALDNGAFPAWRSGSPVLDWTPYYNWVDELRFIPNCDFAVIPDVIDGSELENDKLIEEWPFGNVGAPVWHMHETLSRLDKLINEWPRVCIGSSGEFSTVGDRLWWRRIYETMAVACDCLGRPKTKLHGLRMLNSKIFGKLPLSSADSTNIARNVGIDKAWYGSYPPATKAARATVLRGRIEKSNSARIFNFIEVFNEYLCD